MELDNRAAVHLCLGHTHALTYTGTHTYALRYINNGGIPKSDPLGTKPDRDLNKGLVVSGGSLWFRVRGSMRSILHGS